MLVLFHTKDVIFGNWSLITNLYFCLTEMIQNQQEAHILSHQKITQGKTCLLLKSFSTIFHRKFDKGVIFHLFLAILRFTKISRSKSLRVVILITSSSWQPPSSQFPMVILIIFLTKHFMVTARLECTDRPQCLRFYFKSRERDGPVPHPNLPKGGGTRWNARKWRNLCV